MNRLSWDSTALRRAQPERPSTKQEPQLPNDELLQPAWRELRRIHHF